MNESVKTTRREITRWLAAHRDGDPAAMDQVVATLYPELRRIAGRQLARQSGETSLDTVGLVNEAYLRLVDEKRLAWRDRSHFYAIAARTMRRILVDQARRRSAAKRGAGFRPLTLEPDRVAGEEPDELILAVDRALEALSSFNERLALVVECRFFAGHSTEETAGILDLSPRTVERDWQRARSWLASELT